MRQAALALGVALAFAGGARAQLELVRSRDAALVGEQLELAPGGFAAIAEGERSWMCFNALGERARVSFAGGSVAVDEPAGLSCSAPPGGAASCARDDGRELSCAARRVVAATAAEPAPRLTVFILDLGANDVAPALAELASDLVTSELARIDRLSVTSGDDVRRMLEVESTRQNAGCSDEASCLAEVAGALGARFLVVGSVGQLERALRVDLSLIDAAQARTLARESVEARDVEDLSRRLPVVARNLVADSVGGERVELAPLDLGRRMGDPAALLGAAAVGGVVVASAALTLGSLFALTYLWRIHPDAVAAVALFGSPVAILLVALVGAGVAAAADVVAGYPVVPGRVAASSCTPACVLGAATPSSCFLGLLSMSIVAAELGMPNTNDTQMQLLPLGTTVSLVALGVGVLAAGALAAVSYEAAVGVLGDEPPLAPAPPTATAQQGGALAY